MIQTGWVLFYRSGCRRKLSAVKLQIRKKIKKEKIGKKRRAYVYNNKKEEERKKHIQSEMGIDRFRVGDGGRRVQGSTADRARL